MYPSPHKYLRGNHHSTDMRKILICSQLLASIFQMMTHCQSPPSPTLCHDSENLSQLITLMGSYGDRINKDKMAHQFTWFINWLHFVYILVFHLGLEDCSQDVPLWLGIIDKRIFERKTNIRQKRKYEATHQLKL